MDNDILKNIADLWVQNGGTARMFEREWLSIRDYIREFSVNIPCEECGGDGYVVAYRETDSPYRAVCTTCG